MDEREGKKERAKGLEVWIKERERKGRKDN